MKIFRYTVSADSAAPPRLGLLSDDGKQLADLRRAYAALLAKGGDAHANRAARVRFPSDVAGWLAGGAAAWAALSDVADFLAGGAKEGLDGRPLHRVLDSVTLCAPIQPPKMIAVGRNYSEHLAEMRGAAPIDMAVPSAWIKANSCICGPNDDIIKPHMVELLDYETELSVVIGERCKNVPEKNAYDVIAGYTIVNDISARDIARIERKEQNQLLGKMFDTFAPMGPCFVTKDEVAEPMELALRTRVNGETRQDSRTGNMIWNIRQQIAFLSQMTLDAGDVILTGTPSGVASGHKVEGENWFMKDGDVLESELEIIGTMRNVVSDAPERETSWDWTSAKAGMKK
jgi:2-keto-4-pentenoate hydratase/2-oxohepta-3-ene-1,7-dioic acid hydratase in catechol pathway